MSDALAVVGVGAEVHVEVDDRGGGEGVERGGEVGHGGGEDCGDEQAGDADGHLADDEGGEDAVGACEHRGVLAVEDVEACADQEEERELDEDDDAGERRARRDSRRLRAASMRCTISWSVPCEAMVRKVPPRRRPRRCRWW
jgi:hypothetical protein